MLTDADRRRARYLTTSTRPRRRTSDAAAETTRLYAAVTPGLLAEVERYAEAQRVSRSMAVEQLLGAGLASEAVTAALDVGLNRDPNRMAR